MQPSELRHPRPVGVATPSCKAAPKSGRQKTAPILVGLSQKSGAPPATPNQPPTALWRAARRPTAASSGAEPRRQPRHVGERAGRAAGGCEREPGLPCPSGPLLPSRVRRGAGDPCAAAPGTSPFCHAQLWPPQPNLHPRSALAVGHLATREKPVSRRSSANDLSFGLDGFWYQADPDMLPRLWPGARAAPCVAMAATGRGAAAGVGDEQRQRRRSTNCMASDAWAWASSEGMASRQAQTKICVTLTSVFPVLTPHTQTHVRTRTHARAPTQPEIRSGGDADPH